MPSPLDEICCAHIPATSLAGLAEVRCADGVEVIADADACWLRWPAGSDEVLRQVLPLPGVELYVHRIGQWYRFGSRLPVEGPPVGAVSLRLDRMLTPARIEPEETPPAAWQPVPLRLVRDGAARATSAVCCSLAGFAAWVETAFTTRLAALRAARLGDTILVLGKQLPLLADGTRFWGRRVLAPLGFRAEPALPESSLVQVLRLTADEIALLGEDGVEVVPAEALQPVTRAGVRLACRERTP